MTKLIAVNARRFPEQTGQRCKRKAIPGGTVCRWHGGAASQVKVKAAIRAEVMNWGLGDSHVEPRRGPAPSRNPECRSSRDVRPAAARSFRCCRAAEGGARKGTNIEA